MKSTTLDTIINGTKIKAEYVYNKDYAIPKKLETCYEKAFSSASELYNSLKYFAGFAYNVIMRK